jgi:hypothetical protein
MDVTVPLPIFIAQWVMLFALLGLMTLLFRRLGLLVGGSEASTSDASVSRVGLVAGTLAPSFEGVIVTAEHEHPMSWHPPTSHPTLLMFGDPLCGGCEKSVTALNKVLGSKDLGRIDAYVLTSEEPSIIRAVAAFRTSAVPIVRVDRAISLGDFAVRATPFFYAIGPNGRLLAGRSGSDGGAIQELVNDLRQLQSEVSAEESAKSLRVPTSQIMRSEFESHGGHTHDLQA